MAKHSIPTKPDHDPPSLSLGSMLLVSRVCMNRVNCGTFTPTSTCSSEMAARTKWDGNAHS